MKRWMVLPVLAVAFGASGLPAQATGVPEPGTACGSTAQVAPAVAGVLNPEEVHWYDASYSDIDLGVDDAGQRELKIDNLLPPTSNPLAPQTLIQLYAWDSEDVDSPCTRIASTGCSWMPTYCPTGRLIGPSPGIITQPEPGNYQVTVVHAGWTDTPMGYNVRVHVGGY